MDEFLGSDGVNSNSWEVGEGSGNQAKVLKGFPSVVAASGLGSEGSASAEKLVGMLLNELSSCSKVKGLVLEVTPIVKKVVGFVSEGPPRADAASSLVSGLSAL